MPEGGTLISLLLFFRFYMQPIYTICHKCAIVHRSRIIFVYIYFNTFLPPLSALVQSLANDVPHFHAWLVERVENFDSFEYELNSIESVDWLWHTTGGNLLIRKSCGHCRCDRFLGACQQCHEIVTMIELNGEWVSKYYSSLHCSSTCNGIPSYPWEKLSK